MSEDGAAVAIPIMSFPPEVRAMIFVSSVAFSKTLWRPRGMPESKKRRLPSTSLDLSILCTNKAVYAEAAALFYEHNTFGFILPFRPRSWGRTIFNDYMEPTTTTTTIATRRTTPTEFDEGSDDTMYDIEGECRKALTVPTLFIDRLRHVVLHKPLPGFWPDGPLTDSALGPEGLGEKELATMLDYVATNNGILTSIVVELQRELQVDTIQWDEDPLTLLGELDRERRFSRIVETLPQLRSLEIWKGRQCDVYNMRRYDDFPGGSLETGKVHIEEIGEAKLKQVKADHFKDLKDARYERKGWGDYVEEQEGSLFMKEGFVLNFT